MKKNSRTFLNILLWAMTLAWIGLSFFLSLQDGRETTGLSLRIARFLVRCLAGLGLSVPLTVFHTALRSFAHFGVFFVLGLLLTSAMRLTFPRRRPFLLSALISVPVAVLAEVVKKNVPGRHLSWPEAGLNVLGALCGAAAALIIVLIAAKLSRRERRP